MTGVQLALDIPLPAPRTPRRPAGTVPADRPDARWIRTPAGLRPIADVPTGGLL